MKTKAHYKRTAKKLERFKTVIKDRVKQQTADQLVAQQQSTGSNIKVSPLVFLILPF